MERTSISIIEKLRGAGFEAYWAGGTVRDFLMGKEPKDYDIVTSAKPGELESLLEHTIPIGKKFGVILAVLNGHHFEIATFRSDASYTDGRRPDAVFFTNPEEDAKRRDFTINGMFYDPIDKKVLDFVNGQEDIKKKVLRFIGAPADRIREDNLRLLRAIRFKNYLGFEYSPGTLKAIRESADLINNVSKERIAQEFTKILTRKGRANALREMDEVGVLEKILPEAVALKGVKQPEKFHEEGDVFTHTLAALDSLPEKTSKELAWGVLLHDIGKPDTYAVTDHIRFNEHAHVGSEIVEKIGRRLGFSNNMIENLKWLVAHHMMIGDIPTMKKTRQGHWIHHPLFEELLELHKADALGSVPQELSLYNELKKITEEKELLLPEPEKLITGEEIIQNFGVEPGPEVGKLLEEIHEAQMEDKIKTKEDAENLIKSFLKK